MKNKLIKKFAAFTGAVMIAGTLMVLGNTTEAYASCIDQNTVKPSRYVPGTTGMVTANGGLNVRRGPGTGYGKIGWVDFGEQVVILNGQSGWYYIRYSTSNGCKIGWVYSKYVHIQD